MSSYLYKDNAQTFNEHNRFQERPIVYDSINSSDPSDYPHAYYFSGVSQISNTPNRYPYIYKQRPINTLYSSDTYKVNKPFPFTDRGRPAEKQIWSGVSLKYENLIDHLKKKNLL
jgi:hypothetical protein